MRIQFLFTLLLTAAFWPKARLYHLFQDLDIWNTSWRQLSLLGNGWGALHSLMYLMCGLGHQSGSPNHQTQLILMLPGMIRLCRLCQHLPWSWLLQCHLWQLRIPLTHTCLHPIAGPLVCTLPPRDGRLVSVLLNFLIPCTYLWSLRFIDHSTWESFLLRSVSFWLGPSLSGTSISL